MSSQLNFLSSPKQSVQVRRASESDTRLLVPYAPNFTSSSTHPPPNTDSPTRATTSPPFAPFDDNAIEVIDMPRWQRILDDHFARIFRHSILLSDRPPIDDMAARALQIVGIPTRAKARGLATAVYAHWVRIQSRSKDANVAAPQIVAFVSGMAGRLGRTDLQAQKHFMEQLDRLCIERLKLTWRWYTAASLRKALPISISGQESFMQVMSVIAMISHLYRAGLFQHGAALKGMKHIATMVPWPDAVAVIYALMHKLGPQFALEPAGWRFVQHLLAEILPLTANRVPFDPICQLVFAINTLLAEWQNRTSVTLYQT